MKNRNLDAWIEFMDITMQRLLNLSLLELELISINFYAKCNRKSIFSHVKVLVSMKYLVLLRLHLVLLRFYLVLYHILTVRGLILLLFLIRGIFAVTCECFFMHTG